MRARATDCVSTRRRVFCIECGCASECYVCVGGCEYWATSNTGTVLTVALPPFLCRYDIGDILLDVSGTEDTWVAPSAGQIADDSMRLKMGASYTRRTFRVCGTTLTQHFNPDTDTDECEQMVAALSDGSFATMERAVDVPEESAEEASSPASDAPEVVPADSDGERSATASPPFYDGGLKRNVAAVMTVGTPAGLQASILADGAVRQRLLDSSLPRVGRHLDLGSIACEISRTYLSDGSVVRCFYSRSLEILTASGTLHRRNKAGDWTTVSADGKRSMTSASGETSELEALRITTRTDPVTKSVVRTRSDKVVMVANSDGSSSVEYVASHLLPTPRGLSAWERECVLVCPVVDMDQPTLQVP